MPCCGKTKNVIKKVGHIAKVKVSNAFGIKLFQAVSERYAREQIPRKITLNTSRVVAKFLQKSIGQEDKQHFVMLSLDAYTNLIEISNIYIGSLTASIVNSREFFKDAILIYAVKINI